MIVQFNNRLRTDYLGGDPAHWELVTPFYSMVNGEEIIVPQGFITDFGSVPRLPLAYAMAGNRCPRACTLHDYLYNTGIYSRAFADEVFYNALLLEFKEIVDSYRVTEASAFKIAMLQKKYDAIAKIMYAGVRVGGAAHFRKVSDVNTPMDIDPAVSAQNIHGSSTSTAVSRSFIPGH